MIQDYFDSYLGKARYEMIDDGSRFYAEIKELRGVWAVGQTLEDCRQNLISSLEGWFVFRLRKNLPVPNFNFPKVKFLTKTRTKAYA
ncbi:MAG: type II toxin-antitoxin system HicB family antitoxin [Candidatus Vogelbacteria bacterium]|nr:type II toxin-antitoxin system HicB family antitoxin [Candidatus Vogelbacteria bacterium]